MKVYLDEIFDVLITMTILFLFKMFVFPIPILYILLKLVDRAFDTKQTKLQKLVNEKIVKIKN